MEALYFVLGTALGGVVAITIMAMLFVAKRADENRENVSSNLNSVTTEEVA